MNIHVVFNDVDAPTKARLEAYWEKKLPRVQKLLATYPSGLEEIRLTISHHRQDLDRSFYEVRAVVHLPAGTLASHSEDHDPQVALDHVVDELVGEIRRHREKVRRDWVYKRKNRAREDLSAAGPLLHKDVEHGWRADYFRLLRPQLRFLRDFARRELRSLEIQGLLHRGELTVDDVLDEVVSQAWQKYPEGPRMLSLDLWLTDLLLDTLEQYIKQEPRHHASLERTVDGATRDEPPREEKEDWWTELLGDEVSFTLGDLIPDAEESEAWEQLAEEEQRDRLLSLMSDLPPQRRQAFLLYALEDYNTAEIATIQDRPESQVKADIDAARKLLRERLAAGGFVRESGEPATAGATGAKWQG